MDWYYRNHLIFLKSWSEVSKSKEDGSLVYTFTWSPVYISNFGRILGVMLKILEEWSGDKLSYEGALHLAINEAEEGTAEYVSKEDSPKYVKTHVFLVRCRICKKWIGGNITSIKGHLGNKHVLFFKHSASQKWREIILKCNIKKITLDILEDHNEYESRFKKLSKLTLSYFPIMNINDYNKEIYEKCNEIPLSLQDVDHRYQQAAYDMLVRFAPVLGLTPNRAQTGGLAALITVNQFAYVYIYIIFLINPINLHTNLKIYK